MFAGLLARLNFRAQSRIERFHAFVVADGKKRRIRAFFTAIPVRGVLLKTNRNTIAMFYTNVIAIG